MPFSMILCEKCKVDLLTGRPVNICRGLLEVQLCHACQRAFDQFIDSHPVKVEYVESGKMIEYWLAQAHWRDVQDKYLQAIRLYRESHKALRQIVFQWISETPNSSTP